MAPPPAPSQARPTTAGIDKVTITATDGSGIAGSASFTWTITGAVSVTNPGNQADATGSAITPLANSATDTQTGATFTWAATGLPTGLSLNSASGAITGTPRWPATYNVGITATDSLGYSGSASFTWTITGAVSVTNPGDQSSAAGSAITPLLSTATDTQAGTTFTWAATGLPAGLSIAAATGTITGTPTVTGTYSVGITATDNLGNTGSASFKWTVTGAVAVTNPGARSSAAGSAITPLLSTATDTQTGASFTWSSTGLPTGLVINGGTGTITGTPTVAGTYDVTLTATDSSGNSGSASFSWTVVGAVAVTNPGAQSSAAGSAITTLANSATDSSSGPPLPGRPPGCPRG